MSTLVDLLKGLYEMKRLTLEQVGEGVSKGTISEAEYKYITGQDYPA